MRANVRTPAVGGLAFSEIFLSGSREKSTQRFGNKSKRRGLQAPTEQRVVLIAQKPPFRRRPG